MDYRSGARSSEGSVEVVCGSMFSGKTEELMRRIRRAQYGRQKTQVFKPVIDQRYSKDHVQSHNSNRIHSFPVSHSKELLEKLEDHTRVVGIDEAQFFDDGIVEVVQKLATRGLRVVIAGLDMDFRGNPFGPMPHLLSIAESVTKLSAVCVVCGGPASRSQRLIPYVSPFLSAGKSDGKNIEKGSAETLTPLAETREETVVVGGKELYEARCRFCHEPEAVMTPYAWLTTEFAAKKFSLTPHDNSHIDDPHLLNKEQGQKGHA